jgi:hypothetical protein
MPAHRKLSTDHVERFLRRQALHPPLPCLVARVHEDDVVGVRKLQKIPNPIPSLVKKVKEPFTPVALPNRAFGNSFLKPLTHLRVNFCRTGSKNCWSHDLYLRSYWDRLSTQSVVNIVKRAKLKKLRTALLSLFGLTLGVYFFFGHLLHEWLIARRFALAIGKPVATLTQLDSAIHPEPFDKGHYLYSTFPGKKNPYLCEGFTGRALLFPASIVVVLEVDSAGTVMSYQVMTLSPFII